MMPTRKHSTRLRLGSWLGLAVLLCSCRSAVQKNQVPLPSDESTLQHRSTDDSVARSVQSTPNVPIQVVSDRGMPVPVSYQTPWAPPGIAGPWPHDEYLQDGGDREVQANLGAAGEIRGLDLDDTIAIYDTKDGRSIVEPSNRVAIYAPRFAAVRQVTSVLQNAQNEQLNAMAWQEKISTHQEGQLASTAVQPIQPEGEISSKKLSIQRTKDRVVPAISLQPIAAVEGEFGLHENFRVIRQGIFEESEKAHLAKAAQAAIVWSHEKAVQVVLDGREAVSVTSDQKTQVTFRVEEPNHPSLRVIKTASNTSARPGDIVDFTIRFDNLGDQEIQRVVLIDNLTTRLEYLPESAQSSRPAEFSSELNQGDSLVLRWEFTAPLPVGQGGLVRFHCRVR